MPKNKSSFPFRAELDKLSPVQVCLLVPVFHLLNLYMRLNRAIYAPLDWLMTRLGGGH